MKNTNERTDAQTAQTHKRTARQKYPTTSHDEQTNHATNNKQHVSYNITCFSFFKENNRLVQLLQKIRMLIEEREKIERALFLPMAMRTCGGEPKPVTFEQLKTQIEKPTKIETDGGAAAPPRYSPLFRRCLCSSQPSPRSVRRARPPTRENPRPRRARPSGNIGHPHPTRAPLRRACTPPGPRRRTDTRPRRAHAPAGEH